MKNYLLEIFKNDLQDRSVDFKSEWDKSFADVNYDKSQYDAVFRNQTLIATMEDSQQTRRTLRGKIILWRPLIERGLNEWEAYNNSTSEQLRQRLQVLTEEAQALENRQKAIYKDQAETENALKDQEKIEQRYQELTVQFQFVTDLAQLQTQRKVLQDKLYDLVRIIGNAEQQQSPEAIIRNIAKISKEQAELYTQLASLNNNLYLQLQKLLQTVESLTQQKQQQTELEGQIKALDKDIQDYQDLLILKTSAAARLQNIEELHQKLAVLEQEERTLADQKKALAAMQANLETEQGELQSQHKRIHTARQQRQDQQSPFSFLEQMPNLPSMETAVLAMPSLASRIEIYNHDCQKLKFIDDELNRQLGDLHRDGMSKFQTQDSAEQELDALFNYMAQLSQEQAAIERKARSAVVQVAAILRDLRESLETLKRRMREFNNKINKRQLSDLKVFKIEPREEEALVKALQTLISTSEQVESGNSFDLFDHNAVLDDKELDKAKDTLIKEGEARGGLRVEHLFRLFFLSPRKTKHLPNSKTSTAPHRTARC